MAPHRSKFLRSFGSACLIVGCLVGLLTEGTPQDKASAFLFGAGLGGLIQIWITRFSDVSTHRIYDTKTPPVEKY